MRSALSAALARHIGQPLTLDVAKAIMREACGDAKPIDPGLFPVERCGSLSFQVERLRDALGEIQALHEAYRAETGQDDLDHAALLDEDSAGSAIAVTARCDGQLAGLLLMYLRRRAGGSSFARDHLLYLRPEHRGGRSAARLMLYAKASLMKLGYREFRAVAKPGSAACRLLVKGGFSPASTEYVLTIED